MRKGNDQWQKIWNLLLSTWLVKTPLLKDLNFLLALIVGYLTESAGWALKETKSWPPRYSNLKLNKLRYHNIFEIDSRTHIGVYDEDLMNYMAQCYSTIFMSNNSIIFKQQLYTFYLIILVYLQNLFMTIFMICLESRPTKGIINTSIYYEFYDFWLSVCSYGFPQNFSIPFIAKLLPLNRVFWWIIVVDPRVVHGNKSCKKIFCALSQKATANVSSNLFICIG